MRLFRKPVSKRQAVALQLAGAYTAATRSGQGRQAKHALRRFDRVVGRLNTTPPRRFPTATVLGGSGLVVGAGVALAAVFLYLGRAERRMEGGPVNHDHGDEDLHPGDGTAGR